MASQTTDASASAPFAVVTGASSGIGRALARQFAEHGFDLLVTAEDLDIQDAARELEGSGRMVHAVQADLASPDGVEQLYSAIAATGRSVDAAALNAGVGVGGRFAETDLQEDLRLVDLNVRSIVHLAKLLVRDMVPRGEGRLLFTASIAATAPGPYYATYAASKAFVHSFAMGIRTELKNSGVSVTSLMPGPTDTEFFERADMQDTRVGAAKKDDADEVAKDGFEALMSGKDHVVAGSVKNTVLATASKVLPDTVGAASSAVLTKPRSDKD